MNDNPSIISHLSLGTNDMARALAFYDTLMPSLGAKRVFEEGDMAVAYGKQYPEFWVHGAYNRQPTTVGNGTHVAFFASSTDQVKNFYDTALTAGATCDGPPGERPLYGPAYYGCFVRDPDGHKIEACFIDESKL